MTRPVCSTFSVVAHDAESGMLGVAVASRFLAVGALVPSLRPGVGAVASQAYVNPFLGPRILDLLQGGAAPREALAQAVAEDPGAGWRQVNVVDARGCSATYSGPRIDPWAGGRSGPGYALAGNILVSAATVVAMEAAFLAARPHADLADRLIAVLEAGERAGGDSRGRQAAAVVVVNKTGAPFVDLRVDDHPEPVRELRRLYGLAAESGEEGYLAFFLSLSADQHAVDHPENDAD